MALFAPAGIEQTATSRLATMRLVPPNAKVVVDLLFASSGIEPEIVEEAEVLELVNGLKVPVAQVWHLLAMKTLSYTKQRRKDLADIEQLFVVATEDDISKTRESLALIGERGFARGKDLLREFQSHYDAWKSS